MIVKNNIILKSSFGIERKMKMINALLILLFSFLLITTTISSLPLQTTITTTNNNNNNNNNNNYKYNPNNNKYFKLNNDSNNNQNIWNQNGHDSDRTFRSHFNKPHQPWRVNLQFIPAFFDIPLNSNNGLLYIIPLGFFPENGTALQFINVLNGEWKKSSLAVYDTPLYGPSAIINSVGEYFVVRKFNPNDPFRLGLLKVDNRTESIRTMTNLTSLNTVFNIAVTVNNIIVCAGVNGVMGVNGSTGETLWVNNDLSDAFYLTLMEETNGNVTNSMAYVASSKNYYIAKVDTNTGKILFKTIGPNFSKGMRMDSFWIYALSGPTWYIDTLNRQDGQFYYFNLIQYGNYTDFYFCSDLVKFDKNLLTYCTGKDLNTYIFSYDIVPGGLINSRYATRVEEMCSGNIIVLRNGDYIIQCASGHFLFDFKSGKQKRQITNISSKKGICRSIAADNDMFYSCCSTTDGSKFCQALLLNN
ncbi:hypothetical protein ABK040_013470 [Willaertia magna]